MSRIKAKFQALIEKGTEGVNRNIISPLGTSKSISLVTPVEYKEKDGPIT